MSKIHSSIHPTQSEKLLPISSEAPCGPSLEYDPEYALLLSRMTPRGEAQYGSFVGVPEAPSWAEIERDCRRLLLRSKDIHVLVWLCRARARLGQAAGLVQTLSMLAGTLQTWPEAVHPQMVIEGQLDPEVRANALAGLADPEGLLNDVREMVVVSNSALRLTVRDVERAFAVPRAADAQSPESVSQQLEALRAAGGLDAPVHLLAQAARLVYEIDVWARSQLGIDAPSLQGLMHVLDLFVEPVRVLDILAEPAAQQVETETEQLPAGQGKMPDVGTEWRTRDDVLLSIRAAREWFEVHEPSSPVIVLLKQAGRSVGQRFSQVADSIPLDLLRKWDAEEESVGPA